MLPDKNGRLTVQEQAFSEAYARTGDADYAANRAGYRSKTSLAKVNNPAIIAEVEAKRIEFITETAMPLAMAAHLELLQAPTPAPVRATMVKLTYEEHAKFLGDRVGDKPVEEMTAAELSALSSQLRVIAASKAEEAQIVDEDDLFS